MSAYGAFDPRRMFDEWPRAGVPLMACSAWGEWERLGRVVADLCRRYEIELTPKTALSHAAVQPNLGIKQRGKWDLTRLAFDPSIKGSKAWGDLLRAAVAAILDR